MGLRQSATTGVVSIPQGDKSIDLSVVVDLSDESNTFVEVVAGIPNSIKFPGIMECAPLDASRQS